MFFEVRIYKADGTLKNKVFSTELDEMYWRQFEKTENGIGLNTSGTKSVARWIKVKLDLDFPFNLELNR